MNRKRIATIFILIGVMASLILTFNRISTESKNKSVDFTLDYKEMTKFTEQSDKDLGWWLKGFKDLGINSVSLLEESFESLIDEGKPLKIQLVEKLKEDLYWRDNHSQELVDYLDGKDIDRYDLVAMTNSESLYQFIRDGLDERYSNYKYKIIETENEYAFVLDGTIKEALYSEEKVLIDNDDKKHSQKKELTSSQLKNLGIGFDEKKIDEIKAAGLDIIIRPLNSVPTWSGEKYVETSLNQYKKYNIKPKYMVFAGKEILGYDKNAELVQDFIKNNGMKVGLIESQVQREHIEQEGLDDLTRNLDYSAIRIFSMPAFIQERFKFYNYEGAEEIENTIYRAITERNIRLIYFNPFKEDKNVYVTDYSEYEKTFASLSDRLEKHNITIGEASVMKPNHTNVILKILIALGILGGGIVLLDELLRLKKKVLNAIIIIGILGIIGSSIVMPNFSSTVFAIAAAVVFPSLSMMYYSKKTKYYYETGDHKNDIKETILLGTKELIIMIAISFIGSLFVAGILSDIEYLLEMRIFRGVKLVQLLPIIIYVLSFIGYFGYEKEKKLSDNKFRMLELEDIFRDNIKIGYSVIAGILLLLGYIYLARTGHETDVKPTDLEMIGRNFLELKLIARPRTKEFLLAFPAVLIAIDFALKRNKIGIFITGILVALGQTSVVNTFTHLRTPMYLSFTRLVLGLVFGIIIGIIYVIIMRITKKSLGFLGGEVFDE